MSLPDPDMAMVDSSSLSDHINAMDLGAMDLDDILANKPVIGTLEHDPRMSKLSLACQMADRPQVISLLEQGVDVNAGSTDGMTAMHHLCCSDDFPYVRGLILEQLFAHGANINAVDDSGCSPILLACLNDQVSLVNILIKAGCDVNVSNNYGDTPFSIACRLASEGWYFWNTDIMNGENGVGSCGQDDGFPPVLICKVLLKAGACPTQATLLPAAVLFSTMSLVKEFLDLGMDVNRMDQNRRTPLGCAACTSHIPASMMKLLLENGADANEARGGKKSKPIISAYVHNSVEKIRLLLSYRATVSDEEMSELVSLSLSKGFLENPEIIQEDNPELLAWKLLVKAGSRPKLPLLSIKLKRISLCSSYPRVRPLLHKLLFPVLSLSDWCRIAIRSQLPPSVDDNVDLLPLPNKLKSFLKFSEFSE
ncbi:putative ankyrin repeat protein RF_0381 [Aplysia californica]|uniref:Ankyrin repeat protein RF_0381 n=1 Tax=Aplysia californica TaxID=6500 RepID=A0ABM0JKF5_APLCA|nr:putative ankyrin repeat protein RF_0381 [Aplysia californica]XP_005095815.1 putative ankyrin repeat protein RF_0381 [Aplysia californica]XP_005095816.1 putative ankyrin repeat protein RF_0381 [Aplysia californica]XP_005095817.1 putative ankyrin repeat protein RF_0381 [Aplysia californica]XP_005095818.1 putative ankyrin repeat protein RF_0381 [Aplysia californica]XP_005095819.1 putative ankyrin repeat protein RF_0381 [Aplysia californica]XP_005095820.1 putative ankyrin repeat protein RF_038